MPLPPTSYKILKLFFFILALLLLYLPYPSTTVPTASLCSFGYSLSSLGLSCTSLTLLLRCLATSLCIFGLIGFFYDCVFAREMLRLQRQWVAGSLLPLCCHQLHLLLLIAVFYCICADINCAISVGLLYHFSAAIKCCNSADINCAISIGFLHWICTAIKCCISADINCAFSIVFLLHFCAVLNCAFSLGCVSADINCCISAPINCAFSFSFCFTSVPLSIALSQLAASLPTSTLLSPLAFCIIFVLLSNAASLGCCMIGSCTSLTPSLLRIALSLSAP